MKRYCPKCNNITNRKIIHTDLDSRAVEYFAKDTTGKIVDKNYSVHLTVSNFTSCLGCDKLSLTIDEYTPESMDESYVRKICEDIKLLGECANLKPIYSQVYPPQNTIDVPEWIKNLPIDVMFLAFEVYKAFSNEMYILTAMGIRTLVDSIATFKVGDIGGFNQKIMKLKTEGYISEKEQDMLFGIVEVGHASSHRAYNPQKEEIKQCLDLLNHVMESDILTETAIKLKDSTPKRGKKNNTNCS